MKNVFISLLALAALSSAAAASDSSHDNESLAQQGNVRFLAKTSSASEGLDVSYGAGSLTAYERMMKNTENNENGNDGQAYGHANNVKN